MLFWDNGCGLVGTGKKSAVANKRHNLLGSIFSGLVLWSRGAKAGVQAGS